MTKPLLVGDKVRRLRRKKMWTQAATATRLGISASYLNLIEHNRRALTRPLRFKLCETFAADPRILAGDEEARLFSDLTEIFSDPLFADNSPGRDELEYLAGSAPDTAQAILTLNRAYETAREDALVLGERLSDNPLLQASSHRLLTLLTSIRSFAEILRDNADLAASQRQQFIGTVIGESEKLTDAVNDLFEFIGGGRSRSPAADTPEEEAQEYLETHKNHFPDLEAAAEAMRADPRFPGADSSRELARHLADSHGVTVEIAPVRGEQAELIRFDPAARRLLLCEVLPAASQRFQIARWLGLLSCAPAIAARLDEAKLSTAAAREAVRDLLGSYFAGALLMPYANFLEATGELRHDLELLQRRFGASFEQICHRLTTLQRAGAEGIPFHFLRIDIAGNIVKRYSGSGLRIPRLGSACPRWNVHSTFMNAGRIDTQIARLSDGSEYLFLARSETKPGTGHRAPPAHYAISIGCDLSFADRLVYGDGLNLRAGGAAVPVGIQCRQCPRTDCRQRIAAPLTGHDKARPGALD